MKTFRVANPNGAAFTFSEKNRSLKDWRRSGNKIEDKLRAREFELTTRSNFPILQYARITVSEYGRPIFRGYVESYSIDYMQNEKTLTVVGNEKALFGRFAPYYHYPFEDNYTFAQIFSDTLTHGSQCPGLLALAMSTVSPGTKYEIYDAARNIVKLVGRGTASHFQSCDVYRIDIYGISKLVECTLLEQQFVDSSISRNATDAFIRADGCISRGWYEVGGLLAYGAYDVGVGLGDISDPNQTLWGELTTTPEDNYGDIIADLAHAHGFYTHVREGWLKTLVDIDNTEGRGA